MADEKSIQPDKRYQSNYIDTDTSHGPMDRFERERNAHKKRQKKKMKDIAGREAPKNVDK